jgi:hypothetical protein
MGDRSPLEQALINYCVPRGIRLSDFEDLWSERDREAVWWWLTDQAKRCSSCGQLLDDALKKENTWAYAAEVLSCHGCQAMNRAAVELLPGTKADPLAGARYRFTQTPEATNGRVDDPGANGQQARAPGP